MNTFLGAILHWFRPYCGYHHNPCEYNASLTTLQTDVASSYIFCLMDKIPRFNSYSAVHFSFHPFFCYCNLTSKILNRYEFAYLLLVKPGVFFNFDKSRLFCSFSYNELQTYSESLAFQQSHFDQRLQPLDLYFLCVCKNAFNLFSQ